MTLCCLDDEHPVRPIALQTEPLLHDDDVDQASTDVDE